MAAEYDTTYYAQAYCGNCAWHGQVCIEKGYLLENAARPCPNCGSKGHLTAKPCPVEVWLYVESVPHLVVQS
jgi:DnaJ-class molecular chaperone